MTEPERLDLGTARPFTVAVGVSDTSRSPSALRWAVQEAAVHSGVVIALRAWRPPGAPAAVGARPPATSFDPGSLIDQEQQRLEADVEHVLGTDSGVECRLVHGGCRKVLQAVSRFVDLIVIDAPQRTDLSSPPLFARRLVYSASCPVVMMPPSLTHQPDTPMVASASGWVGVCSTPPVPRVGRECGRRSTPIDRHSPLSSAFGVARRFPGRCQSTVLI